MRRQLTPEFFQYLRELAADAIVQLVLRRMRERADFNAAETPAGVMDVLNSRLTFDATPSSSASVKPFSGRGNKKRCC